MVLILDGNSKIGAHVITLLFGLFKAFDYIGSSRESDFFSPTRPIFLHACATYSKLPSNISTMSYRVGGRQIKDTFTDERKLVNHNYIRVKYWAYPLVKLQRQNALTGE